LRSEYIPRTVLKKIVSGSLGRLKETAKGRRAIPWISGNISKKISFIFLNCFPLRKLLPLIFNLGFFFDRMIEYSVALKNFKGNCEDILLDIGSGYSCFPSLLALNSYTISLDIDRDALIFQKKVSKSIRKKLPQTLDCIIADCTKLPFKNNSVYKIFLISTIEHIEADNVAAEESGRVLKKGGQCIISLPFSKSMEETQIMPYFQRSYTKEMIQNRIVGPSSLFLKKLSTFRKTLLRVFYRIVPEGWFIIKDAIAGLAIFKIEEIFMSHVEGELAIIELIKNGFKYG
jgi:SAM-dependent methyltransferase